MIVSFLIFSRKGDYCYLCVRFSFGWERIFVYGKQKFVFMYFRQFLFQLYYGLFVFFSNYKVVVFCGVLGFLYIFFQILEFIFDVFGGIQYFGISFWCWVLNVCCLKYVQLVVFFNNIEVIRVNKG